MTDVPCTTHEAVVFGIKMHVVLFGDGCCISQDVVQKKGECCA